jgi:hypothetical protein
MISASFLASEREGRYETILTPSPLILTADAGTTILFFAE